MITASLSTFSADGGDVSPIVTAYTQLLSANVGNHQQTRQVFNKLLVEASDQPKPLAWLANELHWEVQAAATGNRKLAALNDLEGERSGRATDERLDSYNQRMSR